MEHRRHGVLRRGDNLRFERSLAIAGGDELVVQLVELGGAWEGSVYGWGDVACCEDEGVHCG